MVAAARLRRAQERILAARPYARDAPQGGRQPRRARRGSASTRCSRCATEKRVLLVVVTGDKGLAGAFNTNVLRRARRGDRRKLAEHRAAAARPQGRRLLPPPHVQGAQGLHHALQQRHLRAGRARSPRDLRDAYASGEYDAVYVVYNQFRVDHHAEAHARAAAAAPGGRRRQRGAEAAGGQTPRVPLRALGRGDPRASCCRATSDLQVYRILLDSQAAEHAARMTAMEAATKNAGEIIDRLTLTLQPRAPGRDHQGADRDRVRAPDALEG